MQEQECRTSVLRKQALERRKAIGETSDDQSSSSQLEPGHSDATKNNLSIVGKSGHINFFQHLEEGDRGAAPNEEFLREQREEKEKYEKSIGYLTYLGQGSCEATKQRAWFETLPTDRAAERKATGSEEVSRTAKCLADPLAVFSRLTKDRRDPVDAGPACRPAAALPRRHCEAAAAPAETANASGATHRRADHSERKQRQTQPRHRESDTEKRRKREKKKKEKDKKNKKKRKRSESSPSPDRSAGRRRDTARKRRRRSPSRSHSEDSSEDSSEEAERRRIRLERLRSERLQRERQERERAERLLRQLSDEPSAAPAAAEPPLRQRYSAQFNPHLARQNQRPS